MMKIGELIIMWYHLKYVFIDANIGDISDLLLQVYIYFWSEVLQICSEEIVWLNELYVSY